MNNDKEKMVEELAKIFWDDVGIVYTWEQVRDNVTGRKYLNLAKVALDAGYIRTPQTLPNVNWPEKKHEVGDVYVSLLENRAWNACLDACKKSVGEAQPSQLVPLDKELRKLVIEADSMIGHLSHRCGIKWNDLESINQKECDELCLKLRKIYEL